MISCCNANSKLADRVDLPPRYRCPLNRLPASRLLLPRSGLERSDFVLWPISEVVARLIEVRSLAHSELDLLTLSSSRFDPKPT